MRRRVDNDGEDRYEHISKEAMRDPNFLATRLAEVQGEFNDLPPGTWVAYQDGKLIGTGESAETLSQSIAGIRDPKKEVMMHQVNVEQPVRRLRSPKVARGNR